MVRSRLLLTRSIKRKYPVKPLNSYDFAPPGQSLLSWLTQCLGQYDIPKGPASFEAQWICEFILKSIPPTERWAWAGALNASQRKKLLSILKRRQSQEPLAYILEHAFFYGRRFRVGPGVLIPRQETELLLCHAIEALKLSQKSSVEVLDLCTGSGCLAVSLTCEIPNCRMTALDISAQALSYARGNSRAHGVDSRIFFKKSDLMSTLGKPRALYDVIVTNPPYVAQKHMHRLAAGVSFEPRLALEGGKDGLEIVQRILREAHRWMRPRATMFMEIAEYQTRKICSWKILQNYKSFEIIKDLTGRDRILKVQTYG